MLFNENIWWSKNHDFQFKVLWQISRIFHRFIDTKFYRFSSWIMLINQWVFSNKKTYFKVRLFLLAKLQFFLLTDVNGILWNYQRILRQLKFLISFQFFFQKQDILYLTYISFYIYKLCLKSLIQIIEQASRLWITAYRSL